MRVQMALVTLCLVLVPVSGLAQESQDPVQMIADIRERVGIYQETVKARQAELTREIQVVRALADAAALLSGFSPGLSLDKSRGKFAEAQQLAQEAALPEPSPSVLAIVNGLLNQPGMGDPPAQIKPKSFVAISRLEEHIIQQVGSLEAEARALQGIEQDLLRTQSGIRAMVASGAGATIYVRRLAVK